MAHKQSKGTCAYCGKEWSKSGITKHLTTCPQRQDAIATTEGKKGNSESLYHLRVQDTYRSEFWLDLEMRGSKTLQDLDNYLRAIWLECCGHMSQFSLGRGFEREVGMRRKISDAFQKSDELTHIYDFGTSSETQVRCVGVREGKPTTTKAIVLMARNKMPEYPCMDCEEISTHLCMECLIEDQLSGTLCDKHAKSHPHHNYGEPTELVNSPRMGMCGYDGPADPPY
ncbi:MULTISPECIES: hypothetical protein [Leptolyngbya]|uniref:hypothetical protein n=1 Tax=Leptolyngbya TaxID=47251 RepID=UPI001688BBBC|nr:hypothetical protein [Leptolyngbya sp. FACHB-1624]MBD1855962.1 hypothetical protein [Leptolyngbya sp. FACHB-1624]